MSVADWLKGLDLGQYAQAFADNDIDLALAATLTDADLKEIGVASLGHRRKLLAAAAALTAKPPAPQPPPPPPPPGQDAERRPITVMFCDLVGSTSLAGKLDAEDWRTLVGAYLDEASAAVTGLGGHVLKKLGDGLMALFGYPQAQENDAERAVRAALAIQRALADLNARNARSGAPELSARIGIECGSVVIDASGEVFGEAPNVAARVQAAAEPGTVLVTASVQRQTAGLFVVEDKGAHDLKGVPAPVALYRIVRASGGGRRGGARALTPLVGREDELALLTRRWSRALEGEGQFVQIVGEPGIGKSRLVEEFRGKLAETPHTWVEWAASQLLQNTPLHPIAEWGRLRFGGADASDEGRLADLENTLRLIGLDAAEYAPLLAPLVDIPLLEDRRAKFPPEELRRRQLAAMTAWVLAGARTQPVVLAFEDLLWADPTSLDLMRALAERGAQSPLLVVATTRPEFRTPWAMRSHHSVISLAPLDRAQVRRMVSEIASRHALSDEMTDGVGERTGGVPLFVEEVTRLLLERDAQGGAQAIPPTLQQSLAARLDRLGEAREVAQIGAVLGRDFSYRLLRDVSLSAAAFDELRLQAALDRLTEADLLFADGAPPTAAYRFKHALIQDAAYESLLKSRRQALHRRAAEALRDADAEPEAIAHHFTEAGLDDLAIEWWGKAGDQALRRSAYKEAIAHFSAGLKAAETLPDSVERMRRQLDLQLKLGVTLTIVRGAQSAEVENAYRLASDLGDRLGDSSASYKAKWGLWFGACFGRKTALARDRARELVALAQHSGDNCLLIEAYHCRWSTALFRGDVVAMAGDSRLGTETYDMARHRHLGHIFGGHDPGCCAHTVNAVALQMSGDRREADESIARGFALADRLDHPNSLALTLFMAATCHQIGADREATFATARRLADLAEKFRLSWRAVSLLLVGWANAGGNDLAHAARLIDAEIEKATVGPLPQYFLGLAAEVLLAAGRPADGLAHLDRAIAGTGEPGVGICLPEVYRMRGQCLLALDRNNKDEARRAFVTARDFAKRQGAILFERRAEAALAQLGDTPPAE